MKLSVEEAKVLKALLEKQKAKEEPKVKLIKDELKRIEAGLAAHQRVVLVLSKKKRVSVWTFEAYNQTIRQGAHLAKLDRVTKVGPFTRNTTNGGNQ